MIIDFIININTDIFLLANKRSRKHRYEESCILVQYSGETQCHLLQYCRHFVVQCRVSNAPILLRTMQFNEITNLTIMFLFVTPFINSMGSKQINIKHTFNYKSNCKNKIMYNEASLQRVCWSLDFMIIITLQRMYL